eukprot:5800527-Alexandrium_andersonii.AAC.1
MSASLVGSEMCIRDRSCPSHDKGFLWLGRRQRDTTIKTTTHATPSAGMPVSYTHLTLPTICSV